MRPGSGKMPSLPFDSINYKAKSYRTYKMSIALLGTNHKGKLLAPFPLSNVPIRSNVQRYLATSALIR